MVMKLWFAAATLGFVTLTSGALFRGAHPVVAQAPAWDSITQSLAQHNFGSVGDDKELEDMEIHIEELVTEGDDPATKIAVKQLNKLIVETLIPAREHSQAADQAQLNKEMAALERCHYKEQVKSDMNVYDKLESADDHKADYKSDRAKHGMCLEILEGKKMVKEARCHAIEDVKEVCHCDTRMVEFFGQRNVDCDSHPGISSENKECCDAFYEHERHNADCQRHHMEAQYAEKQHGIIMGKLCDTYEKCYDEKVKVYQNSEKLAKEDETRRSWKTLYKIQCLVAKFENGKVSKEEAQACKDYKYEVTGIKYPTVPAKEECKADVHEFR
jgi:hypothetical protein